MPSLIVCLESPPLPPVRDLDAPLCPDEVRCLLRHEQSQVSCNIQQIENRLKAVEDAVKCYDSEQKVIEECRRQLNLLAEKQASMDARLPDLNSSLSQQEVKSGEMKRGQTTEPGGSFRATRMSAPAISSGGASRPMRVTAVVSKQFFSLQNRAYIALNDLERNTSQLIGKVLKRIYATLLLIVALLMMIFMTYGSYKIIHTTEYAEIHSEERAWVSNSMPLPRVAYKIITSDFFATIELCSIAYGRFRTRRCEHVVAHQCNWYRPGFVCRPSGLHVQGGFGDPVYQYVRLIVHLNATASSSLQVVQADVAWEQHNTLLHKTIMSQLYTGTVEDCLAYESYFQKVVSFLGTPLGFAGRQGKDGSQDLLVSKKAMPKTYEYNRMCSNKYDNSTEALHLVFRAHWNQREDFYEPYSILKLLENSGGLWAAFLSIISLFVWTSASICKHCARFFRRC